ncbi:MAG: alcohol dehydrogenase catalytic domain-containing protein [Propionibacteriaceae bacterium]|jgi:putative phosphonate catabolism associated alcohol dehydrogenase|nr:alcohol dehydrogenase catalytic domain-containing protein [Propionibacteriaceae bacterium]
MDQTDPPLAERAIPAVAAVGRGFGLGRVMLFEGPGRPHRLQTWPLPEPGPGQALVAIDLAAVCGSDRHSVSGRRPTPAPAVLGHEQVGHVVAIDPAVRDLAGRPLRPGDRVVWSICLACGQCDRCQRGLSQKCRHLLKYGHERWQDGAGLGGGFASHILLRAGSAIATVPAGLPDVVAVSAACATATAVACVEAAQSWLDRWAGLPVVVCGAGLLGLTVTALLTDAGAQVTVAEPDRSRRALARRFGAVRSLPPAELGPADAPLAVFELSGDVRQVASCLRLVEVGGVVVLAGTVSPGPAVAVAAEDLVRRLTSLVGVHNYRPDHLTAALAYLSGPGRAWPWASLVAPPRPLERLDHCFTHRLPGSPPRASVAPQWDAARVVSPSP